MTGRKAAFGLLSCLLFYFVSLSASAQGMNNFSFELAGRYKAELAEKPTGWYPIADQIVFIADLERDSKSQSRHDMEAKAMLTIGNQIGAWSVAECGTFSSDLSRWPDRTQKVLERSFEKRTLLPPVKKFAGQVLENYPVGKRYRYAYAVSKEKLEQFCAEAQRVTVEPMALYAQVLQRAIQKEDYQLAAALLWDTGLPHLASKAARETMGRQFYLANFSFIPTPLAQREALRQLMLGNLENSPETLRKLPGAYEVLSAMADNASDNQPENGFALWGLALATSTTKRNVALQKMQQLAKNDIMILPSKVTVESEVVSLSLSSLGNLRFDESVPANDALVLQQAISLFNSQGDKEQIAKLLMVAGNVAPANPKVWDYLGAILKAQKKWRQAAVIYLQLLELRPFDSEAMAHLSQCYNRIGMQRQAVAIADFLFYSGRARRNSTVKRIIREIRSN